MIWSAIAVVSAEELLPVALEAEDAVLTGSARIMWVTETLTYDYQKVGYIDDENATVTFSITVPQANDYQMFLRVSGNQNEYHTVPQHAVYVNGDKANKIIVSYPDTHVWDEWHVYPVTLRLQGENKVTVTHSGNPLTFADLDRVIFYLPGSWLTAQSEGTIFTQRVAELPGTSYTFDATLYQANNPTVSGIALTSEDGKINYMLEANATEHMIKSCSPRWDLPKNTATIPSFTTPPICMERGTTAL